MEERSSQYCYTIQLRQKNSGLNGNRTHDLCDAGAVLYQLSYQAGLIVTTRRSFFRGSAKERLIAKTTILQKKRKKREQILH